jgi:hypothetical protein
VRRCLPICPDLPLWLEAIEDTDIGIEFLRDKQLSDAPACPRALGPAAAGGLRDRRCAPRSRPLLAAGRRLRGREFFAAPGGATLVARSRFPGTAFRYAGSCTRLSSLPTSGTRPLDSLEIRDSAAMEESEKSISYGNLAVGMHNPPRWYVTCILAPGTRDAVGCVVLGRTAETCGR